VGGDKDDVRWRLLEGVIYSPTTFVRETHCLAETKKDAPYKGHRFSVVSCKKTRFIGEETKTLIASIRKVHYTCNSFVALVGSSYTEMAVLNLQRACYLLLAGSCLPSVT